MVPDLVPDFVSDFVGNCYEGKCTEPKTVGTIHHGGAQSLRLSQHAWSQRGPPRRPQSLRIAAWVGAEPETFHKCYEGKCRKPETVSKIHHGGAQRLRRSTNLMRAGAESLRLSAQFIMGVRRA